ncbi:MAG TPA: VWA domain-containing protein [Bryobacteraceae bacterium]|jgi:VWFA-related protein|nr:VWA domain-containing protein [Bryobacteraceae bacterium]
MKLNSVPAGLIALVAAAAICVPVHAQDPTAAPTDSVAKPRKPASDAPEPEKAPIPSEYKKKDVPAETPTFTANATTVSVDVAVLDDKGRFIPKIPRGNFRIAEDGVAQQISAFGQSEAPMTICMLIEFSGRFQQFWSYGWNETLQASYGFLQTLKPDDNVAVVAFDLHDTILSDFSPDKNKAYEAMSRLRIPGFSESNIFDAMTDMAGRMSNIEGRKAILVIATGLDTFSKLTFDKTRKMLQEDGVPIYSVSILQIAREMADAAGAMGPIREMDFLQADNEMKTFTRETGGQAYFPRFLGEYPSVFRSIEDSLRNQYSIGYHPTNTARDGKFRRIKVQLVNPETNEPLKITNEKGKPIKYSVIAKAGYTGPREVE